MKIEDTIKQIDRRKLRNNTQRVLQSLLKRKGSWMARTTLKVPNVGSRFRDLRKNQYGAFQIECISAKELREFKRTHPSKLTKRQTFYRLVPRSITTEALKHIFEEVMP